MTKQYSIDDQIDSIEKEIAEFSQKLFQAQGMLRLALHLKENCVITAKEENAPVSPA